MNRAYVDSLSTPIDSLLTTVDGLPVTSLSGGPVGSLVVQQAHVNGITPTDQPLSGGGDTFANDGTVIVIVKNGGGGSITVTFDDVGTSQPEGAVAWNPDAQGTVAAGADKIFGPFSPARFNGTTGLVTMTCSSVTSVTARVIRAGR